MSALKCRFCDSPLRFTFVDLGVSPLSNSYLPEDRLLSMEPFFPLHVYTCESCFLVQLPEVQSPEQIFSDYAYFSSYSDSWLRHARDFTEMITERFALGPASMVVEIASNDGYLLQYFKNKGIPVLGIEPARNVARVAEEAGIPTMVRFFGVNTATDLAGEGTLADLVIANNVLAHVPDINDFVSGVKRILKSDGIVTMEFPHLMRLMEENQFDTIYHEHFSYFSFLTAEKIFARHGLTLFDVDEIHTHGGSLRVYGRHADDLSRPVSDKIAGLKAREEAAGFASPAAYRAFSAKVQETKRKILEFLIREKNAGKTIVAYGAPAKGNTLLNYCGIRTDFIDFTVDRSPHKQGHFLPGTRIPIHAPEKIDEAKPDYVIILPWNLQDEIMEQMAHISSWGGRFVAFIPEVKVFA